MSKWLRYSVSNIVIIEISLIFFTWGIAFTLTLLIWGTEKVMWDSPRGFFFTYPVDCLLNLRVICHCAGAIWDQTIASHPGDHPGSLVSLPVRWPDWCDKRRVSLPVLQSGLRRHKGTNISAPPVTHASVTERVSLALSGIRNSRRRGPS